MAEAVQDVDVPRRLSPSIDEHRIVTALEANVIEADTIQGSEVSEQRQRNHIHYSIDRVGNEKKGRSHHISADVLDAVESQKAFYQETFTGNRKLVNFLAENSRDKTFKLGTEYVNDQFMDKNDGYSILRDSYHDAMVAKRCCVKVEWFDDSEIVTEPFQGMTQAQLLQLSLRPEIVSVDPLKSTPHPRTGVPMISGTIDRENDLGYADVDLLQPERYYRDPNVSYVSEAAFAGVQEDMARYELIERGHDEDEVMALKLDYRFRQNEEDTARKAHDSSWSRARRHKRAPEAELVTVYWHWAWLDLSQYQTDAKTPIPGISDTRLYKFCWSQGRLLTLPETMEFDKEGNMTAGEFFIEEKDGMPFIEWTQYKIAHSEFGLCEADIMGDLQWTKSQLRRLIIDNQAMTNTSRWKARHGFIKNPRELLDNNIGSVLWVKDMNALEPLDTAPLSPTTFPLLETLDVEKENRNGMSRLAKGLNNDAISHQNASDMVQRLTNASNRRVLRGVRDYAETFLKPMFMRIYNLGVKYDKQQYEVEIDGQWLKMSPQQWPKRTKMKVQVALTPDEGREKGMFLQSMHATMKDDPDLSLMYGVRQKHSLMTDIFEMMDGGDVSRYMSNPDSPEFKQKVADRAENQKKQQRFAEAQEAIMKGEFGLKQREQKRKDADTATDNLLEDEKFVHDRYMDFVEAGLEIQQERAAKIGD